MPDNQQDQRYIFNLNYTPANFPQFINAFYEEENHIPVIRENPPAYPDILGGFIWDTNGLQVAQDDNIPIKDGFFIGLAWWTLPTWEEIQRSYKAIQVWCEENDIRVSLHSLENARFNGSKYRLPYLFKLYVESRRGYNPSVYLKHENCWNCQWINVYPTITCSNCEEPLYCIGCSKFTRNIYFNDDHTSSSCDECAMYCERCDHRVYNGQCENCNEEYGALYECHYCHYDFREADVAYDEENDIHVCNNCVRYRCTECGEVAQEDNIVQDDAGQNVCWPCAGKKENEEFDENSEMPSTKLKIPSIPGREFIRLCGIEIEGAKGIEILAERTGDFLARKLYDAGLSLTYQMMAYHQNPPGNLVHVERDSSVDWELVIGPINVANTSHINTLNKTVKIIRNLIREGYLKLDMRGGLHIHVGAEKVAIYNAYNLHKIYMYMEDFLYRLGSAKWPYHRSIPKSGKGTTAKSPSENNKLAFTRTFAASKYYGLNFENYFKTYTTACRCGARQYGVFEDCTCRLGKCTFEFRLFNTTANTMKIHAYLALCQALVAKAIELPEVKDNKQFPVLDFIPKKKDDLTKTELDFLKKQWEERIRFISEELPLTPEEKQSIYYCVMNSDMTEHVTNANLLLEREA